MAKFLKNNDPRFHFMDIRAKSFVILMIVGLIAVIGLAIMKQEWFRRGISTG